MWLNSSFFDVDHTRSFEIQSVEIFLDTYPRLVNSKCPKLKQNLSMIDGYFCVGHDDDNGPRNNNVV